MFERQIGMSTKPRHLTAERVTRFQDQSLVDVYHHRLPYPQAVFDRLLSLLDGLPRTILDVGTGTGDIARGLALVVEQVDAIDVSEVMLRRAQTLPNGQHPNLHWIQGRVEEARLQATYSIITGGDSIHWMDWETVFPLFREVLHSDGYVVIIERNELPTVWEDGLRKLITAYSNYKNFEPYDLIVELEKRQVFQVIGHEMTAPAGSMQSVDDYIASFHSRSNLSPDVMKAEDVEAFDNQLRSLVEPYSRDGQLELNTVATLVWGKPLNPRD